MSYTRGIWTFRKHKPSDTKPTEKPTPTRKQVFNLAKGPQVGRDKKHKVTLPPVKFMEDK